MAPLNRGGANILSRSMLAPLNLMYLAAYVPDGVDVRIIDENVEPVRFDDAPRLAGINVMTSTARRAYEIADRYRERGSLVVMGGVHASMLPEEALEHADSVVVGEAEAVWPRVVSDAEAGRLDPVYRQDEFVDFKRPRQPRRDLVDARRYWSTNVVQASRGCPHDCVFCSVTPLCGRRYRIREVDDVIAEVETLRPSRALRKTLVAFVDGEIAPGPAHAKKLFGALAGMNLAWGARSSVAIADDEEVVALAAESGCRFLILGLEGLFAADPAEISGLKRSVERCERALELLAAHGIHAIADFAFGFDSDDPSVFGKTLKFAVRNQVPLARFQVVSPYPGTRFYNSLLADGRLDQGFWLARGAGGGVVFTPGNMSREGLSEGALSVHREYYAYSSLARRAVREWRHPYLLPLNLLYRAAMRVRGAAA